MPRNPNKTHCSIEGCRAWAIRGSDPPLCAPHTPGKVGAPRGNRNAFLHGFYLSNFQPGELGEQGESLLQTPIDGKLLLTHLALRRLRRMILTGVIPGPRPRPLDPNDYARFAGLTFQGANTLSRILRARRYVPGNDGWQEIMKLALDAFYGKSDVEP